LTISEASQDNVLEYATIVDENKHKLDDIT